MILRTTPVTTSAEGTGTARHLRDRGANHRRSIGGGLFHQRTTKRKTIYSIRHLRTLVQLEVVVLGRGVLLVEVLHQLDTVGIGALRMEGLGAPHVSRLRIVDGIAKPEPLLLLGRL